MSWLCLANQRITGKRPVRNRFWICWCIGWFTLNYNVVTLFFGFHNHWHPRFVVRLWGWCDFAKNHPQLWNYVRQYLRSFWWHTAGSAMPQEMKHTVTDSWIVAGNFTSVYFNATAMPVALTLLQAPSWGHSMYLVNPRTQSLMQY